MASPGAPPGAARRRVGNDVVDLTHPRTAGRSGDDRLLRRILAPDEADTVRRASHPDQALWMHWAAKEAAYKVASKLRGVPPVFAHAAFRVRMGEGRRMAGRLVVPAEVSWEELRLPVELVATEQVVHALSWTGAPGPLPEWVSWAVAREDRPGAAWALPEDELRARLSPREAAAAHSRASAAVRVAARGDLSAVLGVAEDRLEIVCAPGDAGRSPPLLLVDGREAAVDVSLSHDGPWLAWAAAIPRPEAGAQPPDAHP